MQRTPALKAAIGQAEMRVQHEGIDRIGLLQYHLTTGKDLNRSMGEAASSLVEISAFQAFVLKPDAQVFEARTGLHDAKGLTGQSVVIVFEPPHIFVAGHIIDGASLLDGISRWIETANYALELHSNTALTVALLQRPHGPEDQSEAIKAAQSALPGIALPSAMMAYEQKEETDLQRRVAFICSRNTELERCYSELRERSIWVSTRARIDPSVLEGTTDLGELKAPGADARDSNSSPIEQSDLITALASQIAELEAVVADLSEVDRELDDLNRRYAEVSKNLQVAEATISGVNNSMSWRVTKPLRAISALIRRK